MSLSSLSNINVFNTLVLNAGGPSTLTIGTYKKWSMYDSNPGTSLYGSYSLSNDCNKTNSLFYRMINNGLTPIPTGTSPYLANEFTVSSTIATDTTYDNFNGYYLLSMTGFTSTPTAGKPAFIHSGDGSYYINAIAGATNEFIMQFPFFLGATYYSIVPKSISAGTTFDFNLYGSNDGTSYTLLVTNNGVAITGRIRPSMTTDMGYKYYKFAITNLNNNFSISLLDLVGTIVITQP